MNTENAFFAYLSLYSNEPFWKILFPNTQETSKLPVGVIVFFILNQINRIKDDGQIDVSVYADLIPKESAPEFYEVEKWRACYDGLLSILEHLSDMEQSEKYRAYQKYSQLAYFLFNNFDWEEWASFADNCEKPAEVVNTNYDLSDVIVFRGKRIDENGLAYSCFKVAGFEYLFLLDLWELMFNPNASILVKQCVYCKDFFFTITNQRKYCSVCSESKQYNKIKNAKQKEKETKRYYKLITDILRNRDEIGEELRAFQNENQYYKDVLKGKNVESKPDYLDIRTETEYLDWLRDYHKRIQRKRGRKHGKTNEASKRNGSDHKGNGQTQKAISGDGNTGMG